MQTPRGLRVLVVEDDPESAEARPSPSVSRATK